VRRNTKHSISRKRECSKTRGAGYKETWDVIKHPIPESYSFNQRENKDEYKKENSRRGANSSENSQNHEKKKRELTEIEVGEGNLETKRRSRRRKKKKEKNGDETEDKKHFISLSS